MGRGGKLNSTAGDSFFAAVESYVRSHHVMTLSTHGPLAEGEVPVPHAATVFYAVRPDRLELIFAGKADSRHARHVAAAGAEGAPAAATITEHYQDWTLIQGVQLWGRAYVLSGARRVQAWLTYMARFPFVRQLLGSRAGFSLSAARMELFVFVPARAAWTDNTTRAFGRRETELR